MARGPATRLQVFCRSGDVVGRLVNPWVRPAVAVEITLAALYFFGPQNRAFDDAALSNAYVVAGLASILLVAGGVERLLARRRPAEELAMDESARPIAVKDRARWARAALSVYASLPESRHGLRPVAVLARVGDDGVELVLSNPAADAPPPFATRDGGATWHLRRGVGLDDLEAGTSGGEAPVIEVARHDGSTWFRVGTATELGPPRRVRTRRARPVEVATARDEPVAPVLEPDEVAMIAGRFPRPGPVEVRVLRALPDVVGEVTAPLGAGAVELLAYLVTHRHRAGATKLCEVLGSGRAVSPKTIYNLAGEARRALGPDRFRQATTRQWVSSTSGPLKRPWRSA